MILFFSILYGCVPAAVIGYLCGCINWAIILTRFFKNSEDIREMGSGNAGMTNVLRSVGTLPAVLTFIGDFLKCVAACLLTRLVLTLAFGSGGCGMIPERIIFYVAGSFCVLGHMFPIFYDFKGGKGIVTSAAMMLMTDWRLFLLILLTFGLVFLLKRIVSLASVTCAVLYPVYTVFFSLLHDYYGVFPQLTRFWVYSLGFQIFKIVVTFLLAALVVWKHRSNIGRLIRGEEKPVLLGAGKKKG